MIDKAKVKVGSLDALDAVVTVGEAAKFLGLHRTLVARYCMEGRLAAEKPGRDWLIDRESLREFAETPRPVGNPMFLKSGQQERRGRQQGKSRRHK